MRARAKGSVLVAVAGQKGLEQPRVIGRRQGVHARRGPCSQDELSGKAPKPAQEPALAEPHDTWVHPREQTETETARLGWQKPVGMSQADGWPSGGHSL